MAPYIDVSDDVNGHGKQIYETENVHTAPFLNDPHPDDIPILEQPYGTPKKLRIAMLGAGASGLNFFKFAEDNLKNVDIICYDKNDDVGGTWYENRYPGCACDIPSVVYQYPWRPAPWSRYYSPSSEIWCYEPGHPEGHAKPLRGHGTQRETGPSVT